MERGGGLPGQWELASQRQYDRLAGEVEFPATGDRMLDLAERVEEATFPGQGQATVDRVDHPEAGRCRERPG